jgi:ubiquinone/menaquinone biosynthesis C-methylase UbiE
VSGLDVCDLGCGEGHLSRLLASHARSVTGIDISAQLLAEAQRQTAAENVRFVQDDAQQLSTQPDAAFDLVICNLALMDIPDLNAVYQAVHRILRPGGRFVFSLTHPCFQPPHATVQVDGETGKPARSMTRYAQEGFWRSTNSAGIRGQVGANHRTLSTYINELIAAGFRLQKLVEPTLAAGDYQDIYAQIQTEIPSLLIIEAQA